MKHKTLNNVVASARTTRIFLSFLLICLLAASAAAGSDDYEKSKEFKQSQETVCTSAERVLRGKLAAEILEQDQKHCLLRFRIQGVRGASMNEAASGMGGTFRAESLPKSKKTRGSLNVVSIERQPTSMPLTYKRTHVVEAAFAKRFFELMNEDLKE